jgi:hypothetical protein
VYWRGHAAFCSADAEDAIVGLLMGSNFVQLASRSEWSAKHGFCAILMHDAFPLQWTSCCFAGVSQTFDSLSIPVYCCSYFLSCTMWFGDGFPSPLCWKESCQLGREGVVSASGNRSNAATSDSPKLVCHGCLAHNRGPPYQLWLLSFSMIDLFPMIGDMIGIFAISMQFHAESMSGPVWSGIYEHTALQMLSH